MQLVSASCPPGEGEEGEEEGEGGGGRGGEEEGEGGGGRGGGGRRGREEGEGESEIRGEKSAKSCTIIIIINWSKQDACKLVY